MSGAVPVSRQAAHIASALPAWAQRDLLARYLDRRLSAQMTLMYWLKAAPDARAMRDGIKTAAVAANEAGPPDMAVALATLASLVDRNYTGCERIARMVTSGVDTDAPARTVEEGIAFCRTLFDWSVDQSSESSVALYSLGNPEILAAATTEIVELFRRWSIVGADRAALEIGCGIGRFEVALARDLRSITGIDVSANMIAAARERCAGLSNVTLQQCSGQDLAGFSDAAFDLVFAVDSFPYLVQSGMALVQRHFAEASRVLRPGGDFVILEMSYRGDDALDRDDVMRLALEASFDVVVCGERALSLWDGMAFHLRSPARDRPAV